MTSFEIESDVALDRLNTFGLSARAERYCKVTSVAALEQLFQSDAWSDGPALVLGGGSNLILTKDVAGLTLHMAIPGVQIERAEGFTRVTAGGGVDWHALVCETLTVGEGGLENLIAIPGSVGAAPVQNIGAYGVELAERIESVRVFLTDTGELFDLDQESCEFGYRDSIFKRNPGRYIIVSVQLRLPRPWQPVLSYQGLSELSPEDRTPSKIANTVAELRRAKLPDPKVIGNVGSFFKNPVISNAHFKQLREGMPGIVGYPQPDKRTKLAAAWLIEDAGLKSASRGAAAVYPQHALVLVNRGGATAAEVLELAAAIREGVYGWYGVVLEQEPVIL